MRIVLVTASYPPMVSGAAVIVQHLATRLAGSGHQVLVLTASDRSMGYSRRAGTLELQRLPSLYNPVRVSHRFVAGSASRVHAYQARFQPDIVHLHGVLTLGLAGLLSARKLGVPTMLTVHQLPWFAAAYAPNLPGVPNLTEYVLWRYARWFLRRCTSVIAPTNTIAQTITERTSKPVQVVPCGLDLDRFNPVTLTAGQIAARRRRFGLHPARPIVLHVGRLDVEKRVDLVLQAAARLLATTDAQLVIVGDGKQRPALEASSRALGIAHRCRFLGFVTADEGLGDLYRLATAFVTASPIETFGLVLMEALASGCPVVAPAAACLPELIPPRCGFLVPPGDPGALAERLDRLLAEPARARQMGWAGTRVAARYSVTRMVDRYLAAYAAVDVAARPATAEEVVHS